MGDGAVMGLSETGKAADGVSQVADGALEVADGKNPVPIGGLG